MKLKSMMFIAPILVVSCYNLDAYERIEGIWIVDAENIYLQLNKDSTFMAKNLPLDVENKYYIKRKEGRITSGYGRWVYNSCEVKLIFSDGGEYYIDVKKESLSVRLSDESGGDLIIFSK